MSRHVGLPGQFAFPEVASPSPRILRALRRGPRTRPVRRPRPQQHNGDQEARSARTLAEWHEMTPGEQIATWGTLRAWVTWLHDRYELSVEDRLPRCWPRHPGLVEELYALMVWRAEIYSSSHQSGQAARYWHAELRQVLHAATTLYAAGCRTGHRGVAVLAAADPALTKQWADAYPLAGVPGIDIASGRARRAEGWVSTAAIAQALDVGDAASMPGMTDYVLHAGSWWAPSASGWVQVPGPRQPGRACLPDSAPDPWENTSDDGKAYPWED
jgi:hypothetical protein